MGVVGLVWINKPWLPPAVMGSGAPVSATVVVRGGCGTSLPLQGTGRGEGGL